MIVIGGMCMKIGLVLEGGAMRGLFTCGIMDVLLENNIIELVAEDMIKSISNSYPIYRFVNHKNIGIIKTTVGAPITSVLLAEIAHIFSCNNIVLFGTCGCLDKSIPANSLIVTTSAYRDEGVSYHYMEPSDYIEIPNYNKVSSILKDIGVNYILGKTWTTDAFYRETREEMALRKKEGCIAVEMEVAACQAVANYHNVNLYNFLYTADNLDNSKWDKGQRDSALANDKRLRILEIALEIAKRVIEK